MNENLPFLSFPVHPPHSTSPTNPTPSKWRQPKSLTSASTALRMSRRKMTKKENATFVTCARRHFTAATSAHRPICKFPFTRLEGNGPLTFSIVCCTETAAKAVKEPWLCRSNATPATSALNKAKSTAPSANVSSTALPLVNQLTSKTPKAMLQVL